MLGDLEWLIWFLVTGLIITILYFIVMKCIERVRDKNRRRVGQLEIYFLEEGVHQNGLDKV